MLLWSQAKWQAAVEAAGFEVLQNWRAGVGREDIPEGTLSFVLRSPR